MVSLRRHFVPNPVSFTDTRSRTKCKPPLGIHTSYDAWNRLVAVRADDTGAPGDLIAQYEYDGFNQRIVKTVFDGEDTTTSEYFYNESWQLLETRTAEGEDESATHYVWDLSYVDAPIARLFDGNADGDFTDATDAVHYYTFDANQNVTALIGLVETEPDVFEWQVVERYVYTPYGVTTAHDADWSNPAAPTADGPLYAGYHFDAETGLYHVRNRHYDPSLGAFTTRDPIGYAAGDANLYRYVGNDPAGAVDPMGLQAEGQLQEWRGLSQGELESLRVLPAIGAFADGSVRTINRNIDPTVLQQLMNSPDGNQLLPETLMIPSVEPRGYRLPFGEESPGPRGLDVFKPLEAEFRWREEREQLARNEEFIKGALYAGGKTVVVGGVLIITIAGVATLSPVVAVVGAGSLVVYGATTTAAPRYFEGQSAAQILAGTGADMTGIGGIYAAFSDHDIATGVPLNLTSAEKGEFLGCGVGRLVLLTGGARLARSSYSHANNLRSDWSGQPGIRGYFGSRPWEPGVPTAETSGAGVFLNEGMTAYKALPGLPRGGTSAIRGHFTTQSARSSVQAQSQSALNYRPLGYLRAPIRSGRYPTYSTSPQVGQSGGALESFSPTGFGPATFHVYPDLQILFSGTVVGAGTVSGNLNQDVFGEDRPH